MTKNRFILILLAATIACSYFFSQPVYYFYTQTYYLAVKKITPEETIHHVQQLYDQKKYDELVKYTKTMMIVFPKNNDLKRITGLVKIAQGQKLDGAQLIINALSNDQTDIPYLEAAVPVLLNEGYYSDIDAAFKNNPEAATGELIYYAGRAAYQTKDYKRAAEYFRNVRAHGTSDPDSFYYEGLTYEALNRNADAEKSLEQAHSLYPLDKNTSIALIRLYKKNGKYAQADRILRSSVGK